ncbi:MAG TPA: 2OG-Fe(II) oxygenase family protein [Rhodopila sp.]
MPTTTEPVTTIPVLDLGPFLAGAPGALEETAAQLREICETVGFLTIINHGVPADLIDATFAETARFHAQPLDAKLQVKVNAVMQGYMPVHGSTTRSSALAAGSKPNENEAFFVKRAGDDDGGPDRWPADLPGFREATLRYYDAMDDLGQRLMPLFARALDLPADYFATLCDQPLTSLRLTHYPPAAYGADEYGIAPHTDSSFITLLAQNKVPGLQIRVASGEWIDAEVVPNSFVVNIGDILNRWSNGRFLSTPHRAFNKSKGPRYAIPYFFHPNPDTMIDCLPSCVSEGEQPRFPAMTSAEYMAWFRSQNYRHIREAAAA